MKTYTEEQRMPTLKELAKLLDPANDKEIQSVTKTSQKVSTLEWVNDTDYDSIFTILKDYPEYEFEIDSKLKLAAINGVKLADNSQSEEIKKLTERIESLEKSQTKKKTTIIERPYGLAVKAMVGNNVEEFVEEISLSEYGKGKAVISFSCETNGVAVSYLAPFIYNNTERVGFGETMRSDQMNILQASTSACITYDENTKIQLKLATDRALTPNYVYSILVIPDE